MSSGRKRRVHAENPVALTLDRSPWVRLSLYLFFAAWVGVMVLRVASETNFADEEMLGGLFGVGLAITASVVLQTNYETVAQRNGRLLLILGGLAGHMAAVSRIALIGEENAMQR